jgi:hypothetical protein
MEESLCHSVFINCIGDVCFHVLVVNQSVVVKRDDSAVVTRLRALPAEVYWNSRQ